MNKYEIVKSKWDGNREITDEDINYLFMINEMKLNRLKAIHELVNQKEVETYCENPKIDDLIFAIKVCVNIF